MLASFRSLKTSAIWRAISIACVMMAFSYILFEVLDLDGSNFPMRYPVESNAIVPEVETNVVRPHFVRLAEPWTGVSFPLLTKPAFWVHPRPREVIISAFNLLQRRGYRAALPRSSLAEDLSLHA